MRVHLTDLIDLHIDSYIWTRIFGYDLKRAHRPSFLRGNFFSQADLPRLSQAGFTGAIFSITTNPFRSSAARARTLAKNLTHLKSILPIDSLVTNFSEYERAKAAKKFAVFVGLQGGNALGNDLDVLRIIGHDLIKITLVHLTSSSLGSTSSPFKRKDHGLGLVGQEAIRIINEKRILLDLAHISEKAFWQALEIHDQAQPFLVSHTGIASVYSHWRNISQDQIKAVAASGGTVGIMFERTFLGKKVNVDTVVDHFSAVIDLVGEDFVSIGSDWDCLISPPPGLKTCSDFPHLIEAFLRRGFSESIVQKISGQNFLRVLRLIRP